jgi:DNA adenine methylase
MSNPKTTKTILRWPGNKTRHLKLILPMIKPHVCYCESFAGSAATLLAKERSRVEVINDVNGDLVALYLNAQKHLPEILRMIETVFSSRELFHMFRAQPGMTEIERAVRFLVRSKTSFAGNMDSFAVAKTKGGGSAFSRESVKQQLEAISERLDKVVVENLPYERCFQNYDSKDTFHFIDPPYLHSSTKAYRGWDETDMRTFRKHVEKLKGQFIITLDDSRFNRELFSDCKIESVVSKNRLGNNRTNPELTFGELIITPK